MFRKTKNDQPRAVWLHGEALRLLKEHAKVRKLHIQDVFPGAGKGTYLSPQHGGGRRFGPDRVTHVAGIGFVIGMVAAAMNEAALIRTQAFPDSRPAAPRASAH